MTPQRAMIHGAKIGTVAGLGFMQDAIGNTGLALAHFALAGLLVVTGVLRLRKIESTEKPTKA